MLHSEPKKQVLVHAVIEDWADSGDYDHQIQLFTDVDRAQECFKTTLSKEEDNELSIINRWQNRPDYQKEYSQFGTGGDHIMLHEHFMCRLTDYESHHYDLKLLPIMLEVDDADAFIERIKSATNK